MRDTDPGYDIEVTAAAGAEPVSLAEAKAHLRVLHADEDALITRYVKAATSHLEGITGRALITRTLKLSCDAFPSDAREGLPLRMPPVGAITEIRYFDFDGVQQTLDAGDYYLVRSVIGAAVLLKPGKVWPQAQSRKRAVSITYTAGYAAATNDLPAALEDFRNAILLMAEHLYYHRSAVGEGPMTVVPMAVDALIGRYRTHGWI